MWTVMNSHFAEQSRIVAILYPFGYVHGAKLGPYILATTSHNCSFINGPVVSGDLLTTNPFILCLTRSCTNSLQLMFRLSVSSFKYPLTASKLFNIVSLIEEHLSGLETCWIFSYKTYFVTNTNNTHLISRNRIIWVLTIMCSDTNLYPSTLDTQFTVPRETKQICF